LRKLPVWIEKKGGLDFACTRCGDCCTGAPGYVWMGEAEIERLAAHLGLERDAFGRRYLRRVGERLSLIEKPGGDCVFWERERGCTVYEARPTQCRTYPFWPEVIASRATWRLESESCPGIRAGGRRFSPDEVRALLNEDGET
jgi:Fe-S-cluster containining protein